MENTEKQKSLIHHSGQGYDYSPKNGRFEVKVRNEIYEFGRLKEAIAYYNGLSEPAAIWDVTKIPELLDAKDYE
jgi:hypothetical protein